MLDSPIPERSKFALIAVREAYTQFSGPKDSPAQLSDGTWVLSQLPVDVDKGWKDWIGSLRHKELEDANLVFICSKRSQKPEVLDAEHKRLGDKLSLLFNAMHLDGVLAYRSPNLILASYYNKRFEIRQMSKLPLFYRTKGSRPSRLIVRRLERAVVVRKSLQEINIIAGSFTRFIRGWKVLMDGLQRNTGEERIHQFVRALEALILPDIGKSRKQFVHRCQTFATTASNSDLILGEAFDLRSMSEHLNDWKPALASYPQDGREDLALLRTRQMEKLACFAYSRILGNRSIRNLFSSEIEMNSFWHEQASKRTKIWGSQLDLTAVH